ncbi:hypothetical protein FB451DRAFT_82557 [Mycena latifolia]|nr:hypothetical protein FB451DRAFT_82557 [Mycena latifolia]
MHAGPMRSTVLRIGPAGIGHTAYGAYIRRQSAQQAERGAGRARTRGACTPVPTTTTTTPCYIRPMPTTPPTTATMRPLTTRTTRRATPPRPDPARFRLALYALYRCLCMYVCMYSFVPRAVCFFICPPIVLAPSIYTYIRPAPASSLDCAFSRALVFLFFLTTLLFTILFLCPSRLHT